MEEHFLIIPDQLKQTRGENSNSAPQVGSSAALQVLGLLQPGRSGHPHAVFAVQLFFILQQLTPEASVEADMGASVTDPVVGLPQGGPPVPH